MALIDWRRACAGTILFLAAGQCGALQAADLTALLTAIEGPVTLAEASRTELPSMRRAAQRQILRRGERIHLPAGTRVTLICSTEMLVQLAGPQDWALDATACGRGLSLPESSYRNLTSYAGRILPRNGALLLELEPRNVETGIFPVLLSPRDMAVVQDAYPRFVWTRVRDAVEYTIKLRGAVQLSIRLAADELHCGQGSGPWRGLEVCSWTASGPWPALEPGKPVSLTFGSRQSPGAWLREAPVSYEIRLLPEADRLRLRESLRQINGLPLDEASRLVLTAGVYARSGLSADAIATYDTVLNAQEWPEARVTLGDLYLADGMAALADREYRRVLEGDPDPAARAAAELGLGYSAYCRKLFDEAQKYLESARKRYSGLGLPDEAEAARAAVMRVQGTQGPPE
jgi:hypothetical protein